MNIQNSSPSASFPSLLPALGCSASFSSINESITFSNNFTQVIPKGINSLVMKLNLNFNQLNNEESNDLLSFLQSQFEHSPQTSTNDFLGVPQFTNKRLTPFEYSPFYPYKTNYFQTLNYSHEILGLNINNVSTQMTAINGTILDSIEPNTFSTHSSNLLSSYELNCIETLDGNISSLHYHESNSNNDSNYAFSIENTSSEPEQSINLQKNNYLYEKDIYRTYKVNTSDIIVNHDTLVMLGLESTSAHSPNHSYSNGLTSNNQYRHSIYIDNPNECTFYPYAPKVSDGYLNYSMFDFRPSYSTSIEFSPKYKNASITEISQKYNKYGFNPNLCNLSLQFKNRSNIEAKRILLFLESHLGYKKFGFHVNKDYISNNNLNYNFSGDKNKVLYFYCPEWSHTLNYYNNHDINVTFVECLP